MGVDLFLKVLFTIVYHYVLFLAFSEYSGSSWPPIPVEAGHPFRLKAATHSGEAGHP